MIQQPELGIRISELRKNKGLTQEDLVEKCKISVRTLQRIESGEVTPRSSTLNLIFEVLEVSFEGIMQKERNQKKRLEQFYITIINYYKLKANLMQKISILGILFSIILYTTASFISELYAQNETKHIEKVENKKKIESYEEIYFNAVEKLGKIEKNGYANISNHWIVKFDKSGRIIEKSVYYSNGTLGSKLIYSYEKDKLIKEQYNRDREIFSTRNYVYDNRGNNTEIRECNKIGDLKKKYIFSYDKSGNKIKSERYNKHGELERIESFSYDNKGQLIEHNWFDKRGNLETKWTFKYDEKGNIVEWPHFDDMGNLMDFYSYNYTYDDEGNWTKKIFFKNKMPVEIIEREYEYYK